MTAFRISQPIREKLELFDVVVGTATQPAWLRWNYAKDAANPKTETSPWEIQLYPNVPFPAINAKPLATGFGATPDLAVESALSSPAVRYRQDSGLFTALYRLEVEVSALNWSSLILRNRLNAPAPRTYRGSWDDEFDEDDIPF